MPGLLPTRESMNLKENQRLNKEIDDEVIFTMPVRA
jgi:hypothetical protein